MSSLQNSMFTCTTCGHSFEVSYSRNYKSTDTPSIKGKILSDKLFKYPCPQCKEIFDIEYEFTYHNPERKYIIWLQLPYKGKTPFPTLPPYKMFEIAPKEYKYRIVSSREELAEKIAIFDANLDDKVVELIKIGIHINRENADFPIKELRFNTLMSDIDPDEFTDDLGFEVKRYGTSNDATIITRSEYIAHAKIMASDFSDFLLDTGEWEKINKNSVADFERMKKQSLQEITGKWKEVCAFFGKKNPAAYALMNSVKQIKKAGQLLQLYMTSEVLAEKLEKILPSITEGIREIFGCQYIIQIQIVKKK